MYLLLKSKIFCFFSQNPTLFLPSGILGILLLFSFPSSSFRPFVKSPGLDSAAEVIGLDGDRDGRVDYERNPNHNNHNCRDHDYPKLQRRPQR